MYYLIFILFYSLSSCTSPSLSVQTEFWNQSDLASVHVGTPDPEKNSQHFGQHIYIYWTLPSTSQRDTTTLQIKVRLKNGELSQITIPIKESKGVYCFPIYGDDYTKKGGLLSYLITLVRGDQILDICKHTFWVDAHNETAPVKSTM